MDIVDSGLSLQGIYNKPYTDNTGKTIKTSQSVLLAVVWQTPSQHDSKHRAHQQKLLSTKHLSPQGGCNLGTSTSYHGKSIKKHLYTLSKQHCVLSCCTVPVTDSGDLFCSTGCCCFLSLLFLTSPGACLSVHFMLLHSYIFAHTFTALYIV